MKLYLVGIQLLLALGTAEASPQGAYALIVGSRRAGPGQKQLKYAHNDAGQVRAVLTQLGGYVEGNTLMPPRPLLL